MGAPTRSTLGPRAGAPSPPEGAATAAPSGALFPHAIERDRFAAPTMSRKFPRARRNPASRFPASLAGWAGRFRPRSPPSPLVPLGPNPLSTRAVLAAPLSVTRDTRREGTRAPLLTPRSARRTRRSHNTHSGSSLSSSSLRGDDLHTVDTTEQVPGVGGGAKRCYPQTPLPALLAWLRRRHAAPSACTLCLSPPVLSSPPLPAARASSPTPLTSRPPSPRACP